jgi:putative DNA primase/helicase
MPISLRRFRELGIYEEKPGRVDCNLSNGRVVDDLPSKIRYLLDNPGGHSHNGDKSSQDSSVITSLLKHGLSPADVYSTFLKTPRGQDALNRKNGHFDDYMTRTIEKAQAFIMDRNISVDFSIPVLRLPGSGVIAQKASQIEVSKVNWIWRNYIPAGKLTLIAGDAGMGKSTMVGDIISRITRGRCLPTGERSGVTGTCLIASAEDAPEDTIVPRLISCGADLTRVQIIREIRAKNEVAVGETRFLTVPRDIDLLKKRIVRLGARILIIDPINAFIPSGVDSHKDHDVRRVLFPLDTIARESGCAIIVVTHFNKSQEKTMLQRVSGTGGFTAAARSVLVVSKLENDQHVLSSPKRNLSKRPSSLAYKIIEKTTRRDDHITWLGDEDVIKSTKIQWLGEVDFDPNAPTNGSVPEANILRGTTDFLRQLLRDGEIISEQVYQEGKRVGITRIQLNKTKSLMNIRPTRRNGEWYWALSDTRDD